MQSDSGECCLRWSNSRRGGRILSDTNKNFQPRFGIAYRLAARTALRASFGVFFDQYAGLIQNSRNYKGAWPTVGQLEGNLKAFSSRLP